jgi:hypothetical protein
VLTWPEQSWREPSLQYTSHLFTPLCSAPAICSPLSAVHQPSVRPSLQCTNHLFTPLCNAPAICSPLSAVHQPSVHPSLQCTSHLFTHTCIQANMLALDTPQAGNCCLCSAA